MTWPWSKRRDDVAAWTGPVPAWAADVVDGAGFSTFCATVRAELGRIDRRATFDFAEGQAGLGDLTLGLHNLLQLVAGVREREWRGIVREHFARMTQPEEPRPPLESRPFRIRLLEATDLSLPQARPFAEGVTALAMLDLPTTVRSIGDDDLAAYRLTLEEVWSRAEAFHATDHEFRRETLDVAPGRLTLLEGESFYVASQALDLHRWEAVGRYGSLVAVPNRHMLLTMPLERAEELTHVGLFAQVANDGYARGPGSVSPRVYWVDDGVWRTVDVRANASAVEMTPPTELTARFVE